MTEEHKKLWELAKKHLDEKGQNKISNYLKEDRVEAVRYYLLGSIDALWGKKKISENEAKEAYRIITTLIREQK